MIRLPLILLALLTVHGWIGAEETMDSASALTFRRAREQQSAALAAHRPWIWEIRGPHATVWLVGCLHLGTTADTIVYPAYLRYYRQSSTLYFETEPGIWSTHEVEQLIGRLGYMSNNRKLSSRISNPVWQQLCALESDNPTELATLSAMEPWYAAFTLTQKAYARAGLGSGQSLESYLEQFAAQDRIPVGALELPKEQIVAMADASLGDQEQFLRETVTSFPRITADTEALRLAWLRGDVTGLQNVLGLNATQARSGLHQSLIGWRNRRWIPKIREITERRTNSMIVVGVEHLIATPYALTDLLAESGFSIHRIGTPENPPPKTPNPAASASGLVHPFKAPAREAGQ